MTTIQTKDPQFNGQIWGIIGGTTEDGVSGLKLWLEPESTTGSRGHCSQTAVLRRRLSPSPFLSFRGRDHGYGDFALDHFQAKLFLERYMRRSLPAAITARSVVSQVQSKHVLLADNAIWTAGQLIRECNECQAAAPSKKSAKQYLTPIKYPVGHFKNGE
ncbi:hypothetical protein Tco_0502636 [Tanacetum coccineum]